MNYATFSQNLIFLFDVWMILVILKRSKDGLLKNPLYKHVILSSLIITFLIVYSLEISAFHFIVTILILTQILIGIIFNFNKRIKGLD